MMLFLPELALATSAFSLLVSISGNMEYLIINPIPKRTTAMPAYGTITLRINSFNAASFAASSINGICRNSSVSVGLSMAAASNNGAMIPAVLLQTPIMLILCAALSCEPIMVI